jgi:hypothetical protein
LKIAVKEAIIQITNNSHHHIMIHYHNSYPMAMSFQRSRDAWYDRGLLDRDVSTQRCRRLTPPAPSAFAPPQMPG